MGTEEACRVVGKCVLRSMPSAQVSGYGIEVDREGDTEAPPATGWNERDRDRCGFRRSL